MNIHTIICDNCGAGTLGGTGIKIGGIEYETLCYECTQNIKAYLKGPFRKYGKAKLGETLRQTLDRVYHTTKEAIASVPVEGSE